MKTNDLIEKLTLEHKKTTPLAGFWNRYLKWITVAFLCVLTGVSLIGLREDWSKAFTNPYLLLQNIFILLSALASSALALTLSVPGSEKNKLWRYLALIPCLLWGVILFIESQQKNNFYPGMGWTCIGDVLIMGVIPGITLLIIVRKGASLLRSSSAFFTFLAATSLGALGTQFSCHNDVAAHLFLWHFAPAISVGLLGVALGKKLLKKV